MRAIGKSLDLQDKNEHFKTALEFYANKHHVIRPELITGNYIEDGKIAREALKAATKE